VEIGITIYVVEKTEGIEEEMQHLPAGDIQGLPYCQVVEQIAVEELGKS
jgi:hypothetical protein